MRPILHISDLHFGRNKTTSDAAASAIRSILNRWENQQVKPVVIVTGDVTQDGTQEQYDLAKVHVDALRDAGMEVVLLPGNHDYGKFGSHAEARRFKLFKEAFYPKRPVGYPDVLRIDGWTIVCLNSMKAETGFFDGLLADGELGGKQISDTTLFLEQLREDRQAGKTKIVVCLHHHPFLFPDDNVFEKVKEWATHWLKDGADLMHKISGNVDVLLFGHEHFHWDCSRELGGVELTRKYEIPMILSCGTTSGVDDITQRPGARVAWLVQEALGALKVESIVL
ncbi:MAG: metallophosphoesterase [Polyangiaceae bacterium]|jgi:3',5'-cyclic AMP phosphodiesterase CpdA|nr:metallophosphoesterase [Polyangiaceae bacterium]